MIRPSEKQLTLAHWWHRDATKGMNGIIAEGAIRSGKTYAMIIGFLTWSRSCFDNCAFILAGRTTGALKRNVIAPMQTILATLGWSYTYNRSEGYMVIGTNTYYFFGASTEASQDVLQGLTAAGCYADEVALFPKSFVEQMVGRCSVDGSRFWFNCNPSYPQHFFKTEWVDRAEEIGLLHLHFTMDDNPSLSREVVERYERMYTGVFYDRYIKGLWTQAEGLIYPGYQTALEGRFEGRAYKYAVSIDYGTQNAFAALLWGNDGEVWHCIKEYRYSGRDEGHQKTDEDYVRDMVEFSEGLPADTPFIIDPSAASFKASMKRAGKKVRDGDNNVLDGIRNTATAMQVGLVKIWDGCEETIKEFAGYVWDEKKEDAPVKENDHMMDALRYFVQTMRAYKPKSDYRSIF